MLLFLGKDTSAITGEKVKNLESDTEIIKQFVKYCNEGEIEKAYDMLSPDCKIRIYPSLERFKSLYYDRIFKIYRMYTIENWYETREFSTYYIKYTEDVLASGNINSSDNLGDYITVVRNQDKKYISVSSYIGAKEKNKSTTLQGVTVTVQKIHMYMDYTIVTFKIKNDTKNAICLDTKESIDTLYLYDEKGVKYTALLNENSIEQLRAPQGVEITVDIKFDKMYNPNARELREIVLKNIVLNYDGYISGAEEKNSITIEAKV